LEAEAKAAQEIEEEKKRLEAERLARAEERARRQAQLDDPKPSQYSTSLFHQFANSFMPTPFNNNHSKPGNPSRRSRCRC
jgi:hypothetical protein